MNCLKVTLQLQNREFILTNQTLSLNFLKTLSLHSFYLHRVECTTSSRTDLMLKHVLIYTVFTKNVVAHKTLVRIVKWQTTQYTSDTFDIHVLIQNHEILLNRILTAVVFFHLHSIFQSNLNNLLLLFNLFFNNVTFIVDNIY